MEHFALRTVHHGCQVLAVVPEMPFGSPINVELTVTG
jgi:hypothetical protein